MFLIQPPSQPTGRRPNSCPVKVSKKTLSSQGRMIAHSSGLCAWASADNALADAAARMVTGYYEADTLAERVLAGLSAGARENTLISRVNVTITDIGGPNVVRFSIPVTENKELAVEAILQPEGYEILVWKMRDTATWIPDTSHPLPGVDDL